MALYWQVCAGVLLAVILCLVLSSSRKEMGMLLVLAVSCLVLTAAVRYLEPVLGLLETLEEVSGLDPAFVGILLKAAGIGLVGEIANLVCQDSGNTALGKSVQILTSSVILWLSLPLFHTLLELIRSILGEL